MMKKGLLNGTQLTILVVVLILVSWVAGVLFATTKELNPSDVAAWIQAIFSVIAIAAAIWISQAQRRHDQQAQKDAERKAIVGILVLIERGRGIVGSLPNPSGIPLPSPVMHSLGVVADKLESVELLVSPSPILLRCCLFSANTLRVCQHRGTEGQFIQLQKIENILANNRDQIMKYYGITDADFPEEVDC